MNHREADTLTNKPLAQRTGILSTTGTIMAHVYRITTPSETTLVKADTRAAALSYVSKRLSVKRLDAHELLTRYDSGEKIHDGTAADPTDAAGV